MKKLFATLALFVCTGLASANVTVTGTGKVTYVPDVGYVSVGISSDGATAEEAWQKNSEMVKNVFAALKALGIEPKDMKTANVNVSPRYVHPKDEEPRLVGYTVTYDLNVTVRKLDAMGLVLDRMVESGANRRVNISFGTSDPEKLLDQARAKAVAEARKKAEIYVHGTGASLGQVFTISEGNVAPWPAYRFERALDAKAAALPIAAGEQETSVSVTVTFAINHGAGAPLPYQKAQ
jgi:uncharacterized protein YggE